MNLVQPTKNSNQQEINSNDVQIEQFDLVPGRDVPESQNSQENIVRQLVNKEKREVHKEETEQLQEDLHQTLGQAPQSAVSDQTKKDSPEPFSTKSEFALEIENILADGLGDIYNQMPPPLKVEFKKKGREYRP